MSVYADTSYMVSLYTFDANTAAAIAHDEQAEDAPLLVEFGRFELSNAIRLKVFRREITSQQAEASLAAVEQDLGTGAIVLADGDWKRVLAGAEELSAQFTPPLGHRALDVLHVAAAKVTGAQEFLTFDRKQSVLAKAAGLMVTL